MIGSRRALGQRLLSLCAMSSTTPTGTGRANPRPRPSSRSEAQSRAEREDRCTVERHPPRRPGVRSGARISRQDGQSADEFADDRKGAEIILGGACRVQWRRGSRSARSGAGRQCRDSMLLLDRFAVVAQGVVVMHVPVGRRVLRAVGVERRLVRIVCPLSFQAAEDRERRTGSTFSRDIAYSSSPTALRASARVLNTESR